MSPPLTPLFRVEGFCLKPRRLSPERSGIRCGLVSCTVMPNCLKCGAELAVNEEGVAPVLCDRCAGTATTRARRGLRTGTMRDFPATTALLAINLAVFIAMPPFGVNPLDPSFQGLIRFGG